MPSKNYTLLVKYTGYQHLKQSHHHFGLSGLSHLARPLPGATDEGGMLFYQNDTKFTYTNDDPQAAEANKLQMFTSPGDLLRRGRRVDGALFGRRCGAEAAPLAPGV